MEVLHHLPCPLGPAAVALDHPVRAAERDHLAHRRRVLTGEQPGVDAAEALADERDGAPVLGVQLDERVAACRRRSAPSGRCCVRGATRGPSSPARAASSAAATGELSSVPNPGRSSTGCWSPPPSRRSSGRSAQNPAASAGSHAISSACRLSAWRTDGSGLAHGHPSYPDGADPVKEPFHDDHRAGQAHARPRSCQTAGRRRPGVTGHAAAQWSGRVVHLQRATTRADAHHVDQHLRPVDARRAARSRSPTSSSTSRPACTWPAPSARRSCACRATSTTRTGSRTASSTSSTTSARSPCRDPVTGASSASRRPGSTPARSTCRSRCGSSTSIEGLDDVDGVPDGCFGFVLKVHHAAVDGKSGVEMITAIHGQSPEIIDPPPPAHAVAAGGGSVAAVAVRPGVAERRPRAGPGAAPRRPPHARPRPGRSPRCGPAVTAARPSWRPAPGSAGPSPPHRVLDARSFPFRALKPMRDAVPGATVNDVALSVIGGALRAYLEEVGELPATARCGR